MIIAKRLKGKAIAAWLGPAGDKMRAAVSTVKQTIARQRGEKATLELSFYFDIADPWSYLGAQVLARLVAAYGVEFTITVVTPPASDVDAHPDLRANHAVRDAKELASYWNVDFPGKRSADPGLVRDIGTALVKERPHTEQLQAILELCGALWITDKKQVAALLGKYGFEGHNSVPPILNENYSTLRKAGHYQGGMIRFEDEWYWGLDRVGHLEAALAKATGKPIANVVTPRPEADRAPMKLSSTDKPVTCEMWFSFRSPYSYLALEQIESILAGNRTDGSIALSGAGNDIPIVLRPIFPMVARGVQLPAQKRTYIVRDAKREADRLGIRFGELCDPLGEGVANCLAIARFAEQKGQREALAFARSAMTGIWAEARDMAEYVDLRFVVERAGLSWDEARTALAEENAEAVTKWATTNATDLAVIGLWGVPSFRVGEFVTWGNDRLPILADRLRRHRAS